MEFRGHATRNLLINGGPTSRLEIFDDRIEVRGWFGRKRLIPRDSIWKVKFDRLVGPLVYKPYFDFRWFENGRSQKLLFVKAFPKQMRQELLDRGWPLESELDNKT